MAWVFQQGLNWVWAVAVTSAVFAAFVGWRALRHVGVLTWDGQVWCLHGLPASEDALGEVSVCIDVQEALLLKWTPLSDVDVRAVRWLWVGAENSPHLWQDLRCAVFATV